MAAKYAILILSICLNSSHSGQPEVLLSVPVKPICFSSDNDTVEEPLHEIECGTIAAQAIPLITSGIQSDTAEYPWHVAIYDVLNGGLRYFCGGSLVSKQIVVTTAHCLGLEKFEIEDIRVHLGKPNVHDFSRNVQIHEVLERIPHPGYSQCSVIYRHDIGLLKLKKSVTFSDFVRPVCLNPPDMNFENLIGKIGTIPGWGTTETGSISGILLYATLKVVSQPDCVSNVRRKYLCSHSFSAAPVKESVPCFGDSGGGLVFPDDSNGRRKYYLRGISSYGPKFCNEATYDVFTDVVEHLDFIKANL